MDSVCEPGPSASKPTGRSGSRTKTDFTLELLLATDVGNLFVEIGDFRGQVREVLAVASVRRVHQEGQPRGREDQKEEKANSVSCFAAPTARSRYLYENEM